MTQTLDIGDDSNFVGDDILPLSIQAGTVTVKNLGVGTINYYFNIDDGLANPDGTITVNNSQGFSTPPVWLTASGGAGGVTTIQITGTGY